MNIFFDKKITGNRILDEWEKYNSSDGNLQLYIHSIFCDTRCSYCDCESLLRIDSVDAIKYQNYLLNDIAKYGKIIRKPLDSIYF